MSARPSRSLLLVIALCWAADAAALPTSRIVLKTPTTTISALHQLNTLSPKPAVTARMARPLTPRMIASIARLPKPQQAPLERYEPRLVQPTPNVDLLSDRVRTDLIGYQRERGLRTTGIFDTTTARLLSRDDRDRQGLDRASEALGNERKVAILHQDVRVPGMLWRLSIPGRPDVLLSSLDTVSEELGAAPGTRPVLFVDDGDGRLIQKVRSSLRIRGAGGDDGPVVLNASLADHPALLREEHRDVRAIGRQLQNAPDLRDVNGFYREATVAGAFGSGLILSLHAYSKKKLLRVVSAFVDFSESVLPQSLFVADLATRFRVYLLFNHPDLADANIGMREPESMTRQWAALRMRREDALA